MNARSLLIVNGPEPLGPPDGDMASNGATLEDVREDCAALCEDLDLVCEFRQSADLTEILGWIENDVKNFDALILNPGTEGPRICSVSDACRQALASMRIPLIELHMANPFRQKDEKHRPLRGPEGATGLVCGMGRHGYLLSVRAAARRLGKLQT